jgi:SAM-dependent methyltransferase
VKRFESLGQGPAGGEAGSAAEQEIPGAREAGSSGIEHPGSLLSQSAGGARREPLAGLRPADGKRLRVARLSTVTDADEWSRRGSSFGAVASAYAEHRPDYPADAVRWCVAPLGREVAGLRVLDLGAGTGKLTVLLAELGADVTAVEPDEEMLAELRRRVPSVRTLHGPAEAIPLPDESVDAVLCGQSMHWFDMPRALPEIARVLVPGGTIGGLWNSDDDRVEWVAGLQEVARGAASPALSRRRSEAAGFAFVPELNGPTLFGPAERAEFANSQPLTADALVALIATHSRVLIMAAEARAQLLGEIRAYLASRPETADGEFELPMVTSVIRAVRL